MPPERTILESGKLWTPGDPDCWCEGTGIDPEGELEEVSRPCQHCNPMEFEPARYRDIDGDGWLDGVEIVHARYCNAAGSLPAENVKIIVIHCLANGYWGAGPRYVSTLGDGREVSWNATIHRPGWKRMSTQHVPYTRRAWHCGAKNWCSIGIEFDGPFGHKAQYPEPTIQEGLRVVRSLLELRPGIEKIVSHSSLSRSRKDPGKHFPWERFEVFGREILR
jgi:hypothetical protein